MHPAVALLDVVQVPLQNRSGPVQNGQVRAELLHRGHLVAGHDQVFPGGDLLPDDPLEQVRVDGVQAGQGLIQDQQLRVRHS